MPTRACVPVGRGCASCLACACLACACLACACVVQTAVLKSKEQMKCCSCMVTGPIAKYVSLVHLIDDMMGKHMEGTPGKKKAKVSPVLMGKKILRMATTKKKSADDVAAAVTV